MRVKAMLALDTVNQNLGLQGVKMNLSYRPLQKWELWHLQALDKFILIYLNDGHDFYLKKS